jgi:hypothetical protein
MRTVKQQSGINLPFQVPAAVITQLKRFAAKVKKVKDSIRLFNDDMGTLQRNLKQQAKKCNYEAAAMTIPSPKMDALLNPGRYLTPDEQTFIEVIPHADVKSALEDLIHDLVKYDVLNGLRPVHGPHGNQVRAETRSFDALTIIMNPEQMAEFMPLLDAILGDGAAVGQCIRDFGASFGLRDQALDRWTAARTQEFVGGNFPAFARSLARLLAEQAGDERVVEAQLMAQANAVALTAEPDSDAVVGLPAWKIGEPEEWETEIFVDLEQMRQMAEDEGIEDWEGEEGEEGADAASSSESSDEE